MEKLLVADLADRVGGMPVAISLLDRVGGRVTEDVLGRLVTSESAARKVLELRQAEEEADARLRADYEAYRADRAARRRAVGEKAYKDEFTRLVGIEQETRRRQMAGEDGPPTFWTGPLVPDLAVRGGAHAAAQQAMREFDRKEAEPSDPWAWAETRAGRKAVKAAR